MSESFDKWYDKFVNNLGYNADRTSTYTYAKAAYTAGMERAAEIAEEAAKSIEAKLGTEWYLYHVDIAAAIRKEMGE